MTAIPPAKLLLSPQQFSSYATLALGSALALFMYPHSMTGLFSSNSANVIRRNAALLPAYSILLFFMALLGFMALAAGIQPQAPYGRSGLCQNSSSRCFHTPPAPASAT